MGNLIVLKRLARLAWRVRHQGILECLYFLTYRYLGFIVYRLFKGRAREAINEVCRKKASSARIIIIKSTLDYDFPYDQRPHHIARAFARTGDLVFFVSRGAGYDQVSTIARRSENLYVTAHLSLLLELCDSAVLMVFSTDMDLTTELLDQARNGSTVIYDYIDAIDDAISSAPVTSERLELHQTLLEREDDAICLASATSLLEEIQHARKANYGLVENAVDNSHFAVKRCIEAVGPQFSDIVEQGLPIAGYYGALASWVDFDLLLKVAQLQPQINFVVIGLDYDGTIKSLGDLPGNFHVLPPVPYCDLPRVAIWFDVALLPFKLNHITEATSPLKFFEYLALGLPVVSTPIPEAKKYENVIVAGAIDAFSDSVSNLVFENDALAQRRSSMAEATKNDWTARVRTIQNLIDAKSALEPTRAQILGFTPYYKGRASGHGPGMDPAHDQETSEVALASDI